MARKKIRNNRSSSGEQTEQGEASSSSSSQPPRSQPHPLPLVPHNRTNSQHSQATARRAKNTPTVPIIPGHVTILTRPTSQASQASTSTPAPPVPSNRARPANPDPTPAVPTNPPHALPPKPISTTTLPNNTPSPILKLASNANPIPIADPKYCNPPVSPGSKFPSERTLMRLPSSEINPPSQAPPTSSISSSAPSNPTNASSNPTTMASSSSSSQALTHAHPPSQLQAPSTTWKSTAVVSHQKHQRLQTHGHHLAFTRSPFWPTTSQALALHRAEWQRFLASAARLQLEEKLHEHGLKMVNATCYEPVLQPIRGYVDVFGMFVEDRREKGKGKGVKETVVEVAGCMEVMKMEKGDEKRRMEEMEWIKRMLPLIPGEESMSAEEKVIWTIQAVNILKNKGKIVIRPIVNDNVERGLSKVLGLPSQHWKGNEAELPEYRTRGTWSDTDTQKTRAYWPTLAELKAQGDDRVKKGKGFKRQLPIPKLDRFSQEGKTYHMKHSAGPENDIEFIERMIQFPFHDTILRHREVVRFQRPIDHLDCLASKYAENERDKCAEDQARVSSENAVIKQSKERHANRQKEATIKNLRKNKEFVRSNSPSEFPPLSGAPPLPGATKTMFFDINQGGVSTPMNTVPKYSGLGTQNVGNAPYTYDTAPTREKNNAQNNYARGRENNTQYNPVHRQVARQVNNAQYNQGYGQQNTGQYNQAYEPQDITQYNQAYEQQTVGRYDNTHGQMIPYNSTQGQDNNTHQSYNSQGQQNNFQQYNAHGQENMNQQYNAQGQGNYTQQYNAHGRDVVVSYYNPQTHGITDDRVQNSRQGASSRRRSYTGGQNSHWLAFGSSSQDVRNHQQPYYQRPGSGQGNGLLTAMRSEGGYGQNQGIAAQPGFEVTMDIPGNYAVPTVEYATNFQENNGFQNTHSQPSGTGHVQPATQLNPRVLEFAPAASTAPSAEVLEDRARQIRSMSEQELKDLVGWHGLGLE